MSYGGPVWSSLDRSSGNPSRSRRCGCPSATTHDVDRDEAARTSLPATPPTLADVAERAGVSRQTVSNAINNPDLLRPDTLARVQESIDALGYSPNRAARNLRTRTSHLIGMRIGPAQEGTANATMDRFVHSLVETSREAGYHVLIFAGDARNPVARVRRPAALDRRGRVRRHRHLSRQPAGGLAGGASRAVRGLRSAVGQPALAALVGRRRRRGRHRARDHAPAGQGSPPGRVDRLAQGLADRRGPPLGLDPRDARARARDHRSRLARRGHRRVGPRGERAPARQRPAVGVRLRLRHACRWGCCTPCATAGCAPASTSRSSGSTTPRSRRSCRPASPRCGSRSRRSPSRSSPRSRGCSRTRPPSAPA